MNHDASTSERFQPAHGRLVVISGPSGSGKTTICRALAERDDVRLSVSATTRKRRKGEVDGIDYWFLTPDDFEARVRRGEFLEHAAYNDNRYGTLRSVVEDQLRHVPVVILEIEVQGTRQLRDRGVEATYLFVMPPSLEELEQRLRTRSTEDPETIQRRLQIARKEMDMAHLYDHVVINDDLEATLRQVASFLGLSRGDSEDSEVHGGPEQPEEGADE
ncbi:MAG: guanylate kinase [Planctomycetes bacterium]|nr:guanylate kinase [Planctomycetota bacterium]